MPQNMCKSMEYKTKLPKGDYKPIHLTNGPMKRRILTKQRNKLRNAQPKSKAIRKTSSMVAIPGQNISGERVCNPKPSGSSGQDVDEKQMTVQDTPCDPQQSCPEESDNGLAPSYTPDSIIGDENGIVPDAVVEPTPISEALSRFIEAERATAETLSILDIANFISNKETCIAAMGPAKLHETGRIEGPQVGALTGDLVDTIIAPEVNVAVEEIIPVAQPADIQEIIVYEDGDLAASPISDKLPEMSSTILNELSGNGNALNATNPTPAQLTEVEESAYHEERIDEVATSITTPGTLPETTESSAPTSPAKSSGSPTSKSAHKRQHKKAKQALKVQKAAKDSRRGYQLSSSSANGAQDKKAKVLENAEDFKTGPSQLRNQDAATKSPSVPETIEDSHVNDRLEASNGNENATQTIADGPSSEQPEIPEAEIETEDNYVFTHLLSIPNGPSSEQPSILEAETETEDYYVYTHLLSIPNGPSSEQPEIPGAETETEDNYVYPHLLSIPNGPSSEQPEIPEAEIEAEGDYFYTHLPSIPNGDEHLVDIPDHGEYVEEETWVQKHILNIPDRDKRIAAEAASNSLVVSPIELSKLGSHEEAEDKDNVDEVLPNVEVGQESTLEGAADAIKDEIVPDLLVLSNDGNDNASDAVSKAADNAAFNSYELTLTEMTSQTHDDCFADLPFVSPECNKETSEAATSMVPLSARIPEPESVIFCERNDNTQVLNTPGGDDEISGTIQIYAPPKLETLQKPSGQASEDRDGETDSVIHFDSSESESFEGRNSDTSVYQATSADTETDKSESEDSGPTITIGTVVDKLEQNKTLLENTGRDDEEGNFVTEIDNFKAKMTQGEAEVLSDYINDGEEDADFAVLLEHGSALAKSCGRSDREPTLSMDGSAQTVEQSGALLEYGTENDDNSVHDEEEHAPLARSLMSVQKPFTYPVSTAFVYSEEAAKRISDLAAASYPIFDPALCFNHQQMIEIREKQARGEGILPADANLFRQYLMGTREVYMKKAKQMTDALEKFGNW